MNSPFQNLRNEHCSCSFQQRSVFSFNPSHSSSCSCSRQAVGRRSSQLSQSASPQSRDSPPPTATWLRAEVRATARHRTSATSTTTTRSLGSRCSAVQCCHSRCLTLMFSRFQRQATEREEQQGSAPLLDEGVREGAAQGHHVLQRGRRRTRRGVHRPAHHESCRRGQSSTPRSTHACQSCFKNFVISCSNTTRKTFGVACTTRSTC